jgi:hypothetical protein
MANPANYEVGFKKPPKKNQYKNGDHGNPHGRPKGTKNLKTDLAEELSEMIAVRENGHTRKISKQRALLKGVLARAMQGDQRAATNIFSLAMKLLIDEMEKETPTVIDGKDREIFDDFIRRYVERQQKTGKSK